MAISTSRKWKLPNVDRPKSFIGDESDNPNKLNLSKIQHKDSHLYMFPYVGTKIRMLQDIEARLPSSVLRGQAKRYIDPFLGGGSVLLRMLYRSIKQKSYPFKEFYGFDNNRDLILTYNTILNRTEELIKYIAKMQDIFNSQGAQGKESYYYQVRTKFNDTNLSSDSPRLGFNDTWKHPIDIRQAARYWFLINTGFARSMSYSKLGKSTTCFNAVEYISRGCSLNIRFDRIRRCVDLLKRAKIGYGDFTKSEEFINEYTFCYLDPPYVKTTKDTTTIFPYSDMLFYLKDHERLMEFVSTHAKFDSTDGPWFMLSNTGHSDGSLVVERIYSDLHFHQIQVVRNFATTANSQPNMDKKSQILIPEYILTSYPLNSSTVLF